MDRKFRMDGMWELIDSPNFAAPYLEKLFDAILQSTSLLARELKAHVGPIRLAVQHLTNSDNRPFYHSFARISMLGPRLDPSLMVIAHSLSMQHRLLEPPNGIPDQEQSWAQVQGLQCCFLHEDAAECKHYNMCNGC